MSLRERSHPTKASTSLFRHIQDGNRRKSERAVSASEIIGESHDVAVDAVGVGPVRLHRHGIETTFFDQMTGDSSPLRVEIVSPVRCLANEDEPSIGHNMDERVVIILAARDQVKASLEGRGDRRVDHGPTCLICSESDCQVGLESRGSSRRTMRDLVGQTRRDVRGRHPRDQPGDLRHRCPVPLGSAEPP